MINGGRSRFHIFMSSIGLFLLTVGVAEAQDRSADYTEQYQQRALEIYRTSIAYRTAASHGQVPALASYLADQFRAGGFADEDIHLLPFAVSEGEETAALVGRALQLPVLDIHPLSRQSRLCQLAFVIDCPLTRSPVDGVKY